MKLARGAGMHNISPLPRIRVSRGFSLAQMLITLVIIGIALAMATPKMSGILSRSAIEGALNQVATDITLARLRAVRAGSWASLNISSDGKSYTVTVDSAGTARTWKTTRLSTDYPGVVLTPTSGAVKFDSRGVLASSTTTIVATRQGKTDSLMVTGVGRIYRGY